MLKIVLPFFLFLVVSEAAPSSLSINEELNEEWIQFKNQFNKKYDSSLQEIARRLVWQENVAAIQKHNIEYDLGKHSFSMGVNEFTDLTHEEFKKIYLNYEFDVSSYNATETFMPPLNMESYPANVDWRKKGYVTQVKNQGQCGSCWSFSTTGSLEGQYKRKTGRLVSFSEKQLVDCSKSFGNNGCQGGLMDNAFRYIKLKGIERESDYPYLPQVGICRYNAGKVVTKIRGFVDVQRGSEQDLMKAVATQGPVSVAIDASHISFQAYRSGVYIEPSCSSTRLDHGVLVVGYGTMNGVKYWLVKNSWGPKWGMNGFIMMSRDRMNQCGIASMASYPTV